MAIGNTRVVVNQRALAVELKSADPILKRVAEQVMREAFFDPAVEQMKAEVFNHPVTQEIGGGAGTPNISGTLEGSFREEGGDTTPNLWGFIGFDRTSHTPETALEPILRRLDPSDPDGPKLVYTGRDRDRLRFSWTVRGPNLEAIYADEKTHFFWLTGSSWVQRIEQGIPGITHFLNANRPSSRSGGGIQIAANLRSGRFKPISYLSSIVNNFFRRVAGRKATGRRID